MQMWIVAVFLLVLAIVVLIVVCLLAKTRLELRQIRRTARNQSLTLLQIHSLTSESPATCKD